EPRARGESPAHQLSRAALQNEARRPQRRGRAPAWRGRHRSRSIHGFLVVTPRLLGVAVAAAWLVGTACAAWAQTPRSAHGVTTLDAYRIGPEDTLLISVWKNDAISKT